MHLLMANNTIGVRILTETHGSDLVASIPEIASDQIHCPDIIGQLGVTGRCLPGLCVQVKAKDAKILAVSGLVTPAQEDKLPGRT